MFNSMFCTIFNDRTCRENLNSHLFVHDEYYFPEKINCCVLQGSELVMVMRTVHVNYGDDEPNVA